MCDVGIKWPPAFPGLKAVDQHLRCGICYEYLKTAMITACSHNYCSVCIRKSLQYRTQCPSCFEETVETHLRNNRVLDELVKIFTELRDDLIHCVRVADYRQSIAKKIGTCGLGKISTEPGTPLREPIVCSTPRDTPEPLRSPVILSRNRSTQAQKTAAKNLNCEFDKRPRNSDGDGLPQPSTSSAVDVIELSDNLPYAKEGVTVRRDVLVPSIFSPKKPMKPKTAENKVACPVCSVEVADTHINQHLDACLKTPQIQKKVVKRLPLPKLVYNLMKEKPLRQKLKEAGLSTQGDFKTLVQRHARYTLLYNAECDALDPRPVAEIIQQVEREEREEKENQASSKSNNRLKMLVDKKSDPKAVEEARIKYLQENKESFNQLIQSLKQRDGKTLSVAAVEEADSDSEPVAPRKLFSSKFHVSDSDPDDPDVVETVNDPVSPNIVETVELSDDSSIFDQQTMVCNPEVSAVFCEVTYGSASSEDDLQGVAKPAVDEAAKDDDCASNESFSLLENFDTDSMFDSRMPENNTSKTALDVDSENEGEINIDINSAGSSLNRQHDSVKLVDSQLDDPSYVPDTQDMLDLEDSNEESVTRDQRSVRSRPTRNRTAVGKKSVLKKDSKKHTVAFQQGSVPTGVTELTHSKTRFGSQELNQNGIQDCSKRATVYRNHNQIHHNSKDAGVDKVCALKKRKVESDSDECLENIPSSDEFVTDYKKGRVRINTSNTQQSEKRVLRQRTKQ